MLEHIKKGWRNWQGNERKDCGKIVNRIFLACSETLTTRYFMLGSLGCMHSDNGYQPYGPEQTSTQSTAIKILYFSMQSGLPEWEAASVCAQTSVFRRNLLSAFQDKSVLQFSTLKMEAVCYFETLTSVYEITFPKRQYSVIAWKLCCGLGLYNVVLQYNCAG
jgi:hypothetical protein